MSTQAVNPAPVQDMAGTLQSKENSMGGKPSTGTPKDG